MKSQSLMYHSWNSIIFIIRQMCAQALFLGCGKERGILFLKICPCLPWPIQRQSLWTNPTVSSASWEELGEKGSLNAMSRGNGGQSSYHMELDRKETDEENQQTKADDGESKETKQLAKESGQCAGLSSLVAINTISYWQAGELTSRNLSCF